MGRESDAGGARTARQRVSRERAVSAQYVSGIAGGAWNLRLGAVRVADVGNCSAEGWSGSQERADWVARSAVSRDVARVAWSLLGERRGGGDELSVRERAAVHDGGDVGSAAPAGEVRIDCFQA